MRQDSVRYTERIMGPFSTHRYTRQCSSLLVVVLSEEGKKKRARRANDVKKLFCTNGHYYGITIEIPLLGEGETPSSFSLSIPSLYTAVSTGMP
jgi:hypothetical protein